MNQLERTSSFVSERKQAALTADSSVPHPFAGKPALCKMQKNVVWEAAAARFYFLQNPQGKRRNTCNQGLQLNRHLACPIKTCGDHLLSILQKMIPSCFST